MLDKSFEEKYESLKKHYNFAAKKRDARLKSNIISSSKVNHRFRFKLINSFLKEVSNALDTGVDIGTGTGVWAEILAKYCKKVVGIDFAEENINIANKNAKDKGIEKKINYLVGDAQRLELVEKEYFDIALHISVLQHLSCPRVGLINASKVLKPNGYLILLVHNSRCIFNLNLFLANRKGEALSINTYHDYNQLKTMLKDANFKIKSVRFSWPFILDLVVLLFNISFLRPFKFLAPSIFFFFEMFELIFGSFPLFNPFFREIIVLAEKKE